MARILRSDSVDLLKGVSELPAQVDGPASSADLGKVAVAAILVVSVAVCIPTFARDVSGVVTALLFLGLALLMVVAVVSTLVSRAHYTFTLDAVHCRGRGLLGRRQWEEPLSSYSGVLVTTQRGKHGTVHTLELKHRGLRRRGVLLYRLFIPSSSPPLPFADLRARQERYARLLGVAALTRTEGGFVERAAADLDKSVRQQVEDGSLGVGFDPTSGPPGTGLALRVQGDTLTLRSRLSLAWTLVYGPVLLFGLGVVLSKPLHIDALRLWPGGLGGVFAAFGGAAMAWQFLVREELQLSPNEVRRRLLVGGLALAQAAQPSDQVEEVVVAAPPSGVGPNRVLAIADSGTVSFGMMLSKAQRRWVRDCIIAVISK